MARNMLTVNWLGYHGNVWVETFASVKADAGRSNIRLFLRPQLLGKLLLMNNKETDHGKN